MTSTSVIMRNAVAAVVLAGVVGLLPGPAGAQTLSQQSGRPQPPPAPKVTSPQTPAPTTSTPQSSAPKTTSPQTAGTKAADPQASKPKTADPQASTPKTAGPQAPGQKPASPGKPVTKKPVPPRTSKVWKGNGFMVVSGGALIAAPSYTSNLTFTLHAEDATLNATSNVGVGPALGIRGGMRVWRNMAVGAALGVASTNQSVDVTGHLPHPFLFNQFRDVEGNATGLGRAEVMIAFEASWLFAVKRRVDMFVFAGPAYFSVRQDMVTRIQFTEVYPYDTASFTGVESTRVSGGALGITAGGDVAYLLSKSLGIGGQLRYSYASATLGPAGQPSTVPLGGLQLSGSVRVLF